MNAQSQPTNARLQQKSPSPLAPRAHKPLPKTGISRSVRELLGAAFPSGIRGICNEHCNPQCLWDDTNDVFVNTLPNYRPKDLAMVRGCEQLCRDETCQQLDTAMRKGLFKNVVNTTVETIPGVKHLATMSSVGDIASNAYNWYGNKFTGTQAEKVEYATREKQESDQHKSPNSVVTQQPRGGTRRRRAKRTRHQKKKQQKKSRKQRDTKHRNSGRKRKNHKTSMRK